MSFMYRCEVCGRATGRFEEIPEDPTVMKVMVHPEFGPGPVIKYVPRDMACWKGHPYTGKGDWVHEDDVPDIEAPVAMFMAEPEIESHYNRSLGQRVESRAHLKALQAKHGCCDVVVKPGTPDFVPRDLDREMRRLEKVGEELSQKHFTDLPDTP